MNEKLEKKERKLSLKDFKFFVIMISTFYTIAIVLWLALGSIFYLVGYGLFFLKKKNIRQGN